MSSILIYVQSLVSHITSLIVSTKRSSAIFDQSKSASYKSMAEIRM